MDLLYLAQWSGCLSALVGGTAVLWHAEHLPTRADPVRWAGTALGVLLLIATLGWWLVMAGEAARPALLERAEQVSGGVQLVSLTFLVLFHTMVDDPRRLRTFARGATALCLGFGFVLGAGAQVAFPAVPWTGADWLQWAFFLVAGVAMHCALISRAATIQPAAAG